jgi:chromosome segregation ATPase
VNKGGEEKEFFYEENVPVNPQEVLSRVINALEHLGNQRFGMLPFAEHFHRWILDVESVLNDFRNSLPGAMNASFDQSVADLVSNIRSELNTRIETEKTLSTKITESQRELSANEREIAELEAQQRNTTNEARRTSEKSVEKLRGEIDALDGERLRLLRHKPTIFERILGSAKVRIEGNSRSIQSKRTDLQNREQDLKRRLDNLRSKYEEKRKPLAARQTELREELAKLRTVTLDDAVEIRKTACEELRRIISNAVAQYAPQQNKENPQ